MVYEFIGGQMESVPIKNANFISGSMEESNGSCVYI